MIEAAPFSGPPRLRPPGRPAGALTTGIVLDADTDRPIAGATVAASWAFERGIGLQAPAGAHEFVTETGADGRYIIPKLDDLPGGASMRVRRFTLIVYHRGHVAWRSDRLFPGREARRDFSQRGSRVRLERWQPTCATRSTSCSWAAARAMRTAAAWELQPAALELEGQRAPATAARRGRAGAGGRHDRGPARHLEAADRRRDPRRHRLRRQVRGRQARPICRRRSSTTAGTSRRRASPRATTSGCGSGASGTRGRRGPVSQADEHAARGQDAPTRSATLRSAPRSGGIAGAGLPGARARRGRVDDLRRLAVHGAGPAGEARQAGRVAAARAAARAAAGPSRRRRASRRSRRHEG